MLSDSHLTPLGADVLFAAGQAAKFGAWTGDQLLGAFWYLDAGQEIVAHSLPGTEVIYMVIEGRARLRLFDEAAIPPEARYEPDPVRKVDPAPRLPEPDPTLVRDVSGMPGDVLAVPAGSFHAVAADERTVLFAVTGHAIERACYVSR